jgi:hypothetical protein
MLWDKHLKLEFYSDKQRERHSSPHVQAKFVCHWRAYTIAMLISQKTQDVFLVFDVHRNAAMRHSRQKSLDIVPAGFGTLLVSNQAAAIA